MEHEQSQPIVRLQGVNKIYENGVATHVLHDIDLEVCPGELAVIQGASGSGKSTLLNIIGLLDTPSSGTLLVGDRDASRLDEDERARLRRERFGFIFQFHYLLPEFTVLENALMPCRIKGRDAEEANRDRMRALLEEVGLGDRLDYRPRQLSGGQQQRVAVVRALANEPALVLADEPTGDLDSKNSRLVVDVLRRLNRETGTAFLVVTHDASILDQTDRILEMVDGRLHDHGPAPD